MVGRVGGTGREIHEERLVRRHRLLGLDPVDRLIGHVLGEVVVLLLGRIDLLDAVVDQRSPLVGLAANEAVELVEALVRRPAVERTGHAGFPGGGLVPLAEGTGAVAVEAEHLRQRCDAVRDGAGVARIGGGRFHDRTGIGGVMIPPALQRDARRRAKRRRVEVVVAQARSSRAGRMSVWESARRKWWWRRSPGRRSV